VNLLMLASVSLTACKQRTCWGIAGATIFYLGAVIWGIALATSAAKNDPLSGIVDVNKARIETVRTYIATKNFSFYEKEPWSELPYPSASRLASLLNDPTIRKILPPSVRPALPFDIDSAASSGFVADLGTGAAGHPPMGLTAVSTASRSNATSQAHLFSEPFTTDHSVVSFYFSGTGDDSSTQFSLYDRWGHQIAPQASPAPPGTHWKRINFHAPPGKYELSVTYEGNGWLSVSQPFTDTSLSRMADSVTQFGAIFLALSVASALCAISLAVVAHASAAPQA
jgi:hypothetical protein